MRLFLMCHGRTADSSTGEGVETNDPGLSPEAMAKTQAAARGLAKLEIGAEVLLTSPLLGAIQTAEIVAQALGIPGDQIRRCDALKPGSPSSEFGAALSVIQGKAVFCVGHSPELDPVIAHIVGCRSQITMLKKVAMACLELESISPPRGVLIWLLPQKVLRRLGK